MSHSEDKITSSGSDEAGLTYMAFDYQNHEGRS